MTTYRNKYRTRPTECEAMQWPIAGMDRTLEHWANRIVNWVNASGGEARYEPSGRGYLDGIIQDIPARIAVRTINGFQYCYPGEYMVMGRAWFDTRPEHTTGNAKTRDFYPRNPETFEKRWEPCDD